MTTFSSTGTISNDEWTHVAVVMDKENNIVKFFRNNKLEGTLDATALNLVNDNTKQIFIGKNGSDQYFDGLLDDVRLYDRAITNTELDTIYQEKYTKNLLLHYDFEEYQYNENKVFDESKNNSHGFLMNKETESEDFTKDIGEYAIIGTAFKPEVDQFIQIPTGEDNVVQGDNLNNCTFAAWVKTKNLNSYEPIIHKDGVFSFGVNHGHVSLQLGDGNKLHSVPIMTLADNKNDNVGSSSNGDYPNLEFGVYVHNAAQDVYLRTYQENTVVYKRSASGEETVYGTYPTPYTQLRNSSLNVGEMMYTKNNQVVGLDRTNLQDNTWEILQLHVRGKYFTSQSNHGNDDVHILPHHDNTTIYYQTTARTSAITTVTKNKYEFFKFQAVGQWSIVSDKDISVSFVYPTNNGQSFGYPADREVFGFLQGSNYIYLLNTKDMTDTDSYTVKYQYTNSDTVNEITIQNGSKSSALSSRNYETSGIRVWLEDDVPEHIKIAGSHTSDGDGSDASNYIPRKYLSRRFVIPSTTSGVNNYRRVLVSYKPEGTTDSNYVWYQTQSVSTDGTLGSISVKAKTYTNPSGTFASLNMGMNNEINTLITCSEDTFMIQHYTDDEEAFIGDMYRYFEIMKTTTKITQVSKAPEDHLLTDLSFDKPNDYSGTALQVADGYTNGSVGVRIGENQHIELSGETFSNNNLNTMTFSTWIKPDKVTGTQPILSRYGVENNVKLKMVDNELVLSINNSDKPVFSNITATKEFDITNNRYKVNVSGSVTDSSRIEMYVFPLFENYSTYLEEVVVDYARTHLSAENLSGNNIPNYFEKQFSQFKRSTQNDLVDDIQYDSNFNIYLIAIDELNNVTIEMIHNNDIQPANTVDENFALSNVSLSLGSESVSVNFTITTPANNGVELYAVGYVNQMDFPENYEKKMDTTELTAGLSDSSQSIELNKLFGDFEGTTAMITDLATVNMVYVYLYAIDKSNGHRVRAMGSIVPESTTPYTRMLDPLYVPFEKTTYIPETTIFSGFTDIKTVYPVVAFTSDVDLSNDNAVKSFFINNKTPFTNNELPTPISQYTVAKLLETTVTEAYNALDGNAIVPISREESYQFRMYVIDELGNGRVEMVGGGEGGLTVKDVDWNIDHFVANGEDYQIPHGNGQYRSSRVWSGDATRFIQSSHVNNSSGWCKVYDYNATTDEWGKFDSAGTFTANQYHDLSKSGVFGHYGIGGTISADGKTILIGARYDHYRGSAFVWQFNETTWSWGKYNTDGSFTEGTPHELNSFPKTNHPYCYYGDCVHLSGNGKRAMVGGWYNDNNQFRVWMWDYDDATAAWGTYDTQGNFVANEGYMIHKSGSSWGHGGISMSISVDGKKLFFSSYTGNTSGRAGIMYYNEETYQWGKFNTDGSFVAYDQGISTSTDDHYRLDYSGIHAYYGMRGKMAEDGNSVITGGYHNSDRGVACVWQFKADTYEWGKYNANGTFTVGTPHLLERSSTGSHYGHGMDISGDGKTAIVSGHNSTNGRAFIWQYDEATASWGKFNTDGTFVKPTSTSDHSGVHMVHYNTLSDFGSYCYISPDGTLVGAYGGSRINIWRGIDNGIQTKISFSGSGGGVGIDTLSTLSVKLESVEFDELTASGGSTLSIQDTDWSNDTNNHDNTTGDYLINVGGHNPKTGFSGDGKRLLCTRHTSNSAGDARIYEYNEETDKWGKFNPDGSFTENSYHNLSKSGTQGHYGLASGISTDGNTCVIGGYYDHTGRGALFVWQYDEDTATWGKFNADGSFVENTPHDLSNPANWSGYYVQSSKISVSGDGRRLCMASNGHSHYGRIWVFDYDDETAEWGRKYADGTFKKFVPNDLTTMYCIETNTTNMGHNGYMSADGKTISVGRHTSNNHGYVYVWKFNEELMEWGRWNGDGTFTKINTDSTGKHTWTSGSYYDLERNSTVMHYGGRQNTLSIDGNTLLVAYHYDHTRGRGYIWQYNDEIHEWGKYNADGTFVVPTSTTDTNSPHMTERTGVTGHYGHDSQISGDGKSFIQGGHHGGGTAFIWQYDDVTAKWGGFDASGTFTENSPHRIYHGTSNFAHYSIISPNNLFVLMTSSSNNIHIYKGISKGERSVVAYSGRGSGNGTVASPIGYKAIVSADKNNATTYHILGTLDANLSYEDMRSIMKDPQYASIVYKETIDAGQLKKKISSYLPNVLDINRQVVGAHTVNFVYLYLYATDGNQEHDDITKMYAKTSFVEGHLYSVVSRVNYDKFTDISYMNASVMTSGTKIVKYYTPIPFTNNVDIEDKEKIKTFVIQNSQVVTETIEPNVVKLLELQVNNAYDDLYDNTVLTTVDVSRPKDYSFFMATEDENGVIALSYPTFTPPITSVSKIAVSIDEAVLLQNLPSDENDVSLIVHDTDWSNETTQHDNTGGDYTLPSHSGNATIQMSAGPHYRILHSRHTSSSTGEARVYDYNEELQEWGKYDVDGNFTKNSYHSLNKSSTLGHYGITSGISADGNSCVIGGYNSNNGALFVWQYDSATATWGKYNADGSFTTGEAHDLSKSNMGANYGHDFHSQITVDGKRLCIGGTGRIWVWDYDTTTATWGTYSSAGEFVPNEPYIIIASELDSTFSSFGSKRMMSSNGKTIVTSAHINNNSGYCRVLKYDEATYSWGAYDSSGTFTKNNTYNLDLSSTTSHYGMHHRVSYDGNTLFVFGYYDHTRGRGYIWKYNEDTHKWGKYNNGTFVEEPYMTEKTGVHGHYGHGGDLSADGKTFVMSGHHSYGTAYIWQYNEDTGEWGGYNSSRVFTKDGAHRIYYTGAGAIGQSSFISPDSMFIIMRNGTTNYYIYRGVSVGERALGKQPNGLMFKGSITPSDTKDSTTQYYVVATTNEVSRQDARTILLDYQRKALAVVVGNEDGYTKSQRINTRINNVITQDGTIIPSSKVNKVSVYLYAKEMGKEIDIGYEDMEIQTLTPLDTKPFVDVSIVQSSFSGELEVSGSVFSAYHNIHKVYMLLFDKTVDLTNVTNAELRILGESNPTDLEMTLTNVTQNNVGLFNTTPTKILKDTTGTIETVTTYDTQYQLRTVCIDTMGQVVVVKPESEKEDDYTIPTSMSVVVNDVKFQKDNTINVDATITLQTKRKYDYYVVALAKPDSKTKEEVRSMMFDPELYQAVQFVEGETSKTIKVELTHVIDVVNNRSVLVEQVNGAQVFVYVKAHGSIVGSGYEDLGNFVFNSNTNPLAAIAEAEFVPFVDAVVVKKATVFSMINDVTSIYPVVAISDEVKIDKDLGNVYRFIVDNFTAQTVSLEKQTVNDVPNLPVSVGEAYTDLTNPELKIPVNENVKLYFLARDATAQDIDTSLEELDTSGYTLGTFAVQSGAVLSVHETDWTNETNSHDNTNGNYQIPSMPYNHSYIRASGVDTLLVHRHANNSSGHGRIYEFNHETEEWGKFGVDGSFAKDQYHDLYKTGTQGNYGLTGGISLDGKTCALGGHYDHTGRGTLMVWQYNEETATWGKFKADGSFEENTPHDLSNPANWSGYYGQGQKLYLSGDGRRLMMAGNGHSHYGRAWIFDYDDDTAEWGRLYPDGTFKKFVPNDFTTVYCIETNATNLGYTAAMSADGKTLSIGRHTSNNHGYMYVWKYNDEIMEWGRWNSDGSFTQINSDSNGKYVWTSGSYYDLTRNSTVSNYGHRNASFSADGNTMLVANYYDHTRGRGYIWEYNEDTHEWGKFNADGTFVAPTSQTDTNSPHMTEKTGVTGHYGHDSEMAADGKSFMQGGHHGGGTMFIWQYDEETAKWGGFDSTGAFTENGAHRIYNGTSNFAHYCTLSPNNLFVFVTMNNNNVYVYKGVSKGEKSLVQYSGESNGTGSGIPSKSVLRSDITNVQLGESISVSATITADFNNTTSYYMIATTKEITEEEKRTFMNEDTYSTILVSGSIEPETDTNITVTFDNVVDNSDSNNKRLVLPKYLNNVFVYMFATDGNAEHDDFDVYQLKATTTEPFLTFGEITEVSGGSLTILGSAFSSLSNISNVKVGVFDPEVDLTDQAAVKTFIDQYGVDITNNITQSSVYEINFNATTSFTSVDLSTDNTNVVQEGRSDYQIALFAKDEANVSVVLYYIFRFELYENEMFKFNYKSLNTDRYFWNKSSNNRWCDINNSGTMVFVWSCKRDTNTKNGVYLRVANPKTSAKSTIMELKYDTSYDYMLPCVKCINDTTFVVAYLANNGSTYQQTIYYTIVTHNDVTITDSTEYTFGTEKVDPNMLIDINKIDDNTFMIVYDDFSQHARYHHCNCGRHGCGTCFSGWSYYYDIQYTIRDVNNTEKLNKTLFQNNDANGHYHKLTLPSIGVSTNYYTVVYQYYAEIYTYSMRKSDNGITTSNIKVNTTTLPNWNSNDPLPMAIESFTEDNFVYVWYTNEVAINTTRKIYIREMNASNGSYVTNEVMVDEFTDNKYIIGRAQLFKNSEGYYDLFVMVMDKTADGMSNHDTYRIHYQISNDGTFTVNNKTMRQYVDFDIVENIGNPLSIVQLGNGKYQESMIHTLTEASSQYMEFECLISSGPLLK